MGNRTRGDVDRSPDARLASGSGNRLLDRLSSWSPGLLDHCTTVRPAAGFEVCAQGSPMETVYFPAGGVIAMLTRLQDGKTAEAIAVGSEGMVGVMAWIGLRSSPCQVVQQVTGPLLRLPTARLVDHIRTSSPARLLMRRYGAYCLHAAFQAVACNTHHSLEQRLARWLLETAHRTAQRPIPLTQAALADMLGVRRQTVGEAAVTLQRNGLVDYRRGRLTIIDPVALEGLACECYRTLREHHDRCLGRAATPRQAGAAPSRAGALASRPP